MNNNLPLSIQKIVTELESIDHVDNTILSEIISNIKFSESDFIPYQTFNHSNHESYGRKLLIDKGKFKILLMSWRSGDFTSIHNHGFTEWGIVHFFGKATHRLYEIQKDSISLLQCANFEAGQNASVCGDLTHLMGNLNSKEFTTLHIYGSNTRKEKISQNSLVYIPERKKIVVTEGSAYLHMTNDLKLSEKNYSHFNPETLIDYFNLILPYYIRNEQIDIINKIKSYIKNPELYYEEKS